MNLETISSLGAATLAAAVMRLESGQSTGEHAESHDKSEQLLLLFEGRLMAEIGGKVLAMKYGRLIMKA
jgi:quercetin dioxygenase-like cupin family protein